MHVCNNHESCLLQLLYLELGNNTLNGSLPLSWGSLSRLQYATLASNAFTGSVPASWSVLNQVRLPFLMLPVAVHVAHSHDLPSLYAGCGT